MAFCLKCAIQPSLISSMTSDRLPQIELHPSGNGTFRFVETDVGVGAVLAVAAKGKILFVQKATRQGYEFSDLWALPGGMVRVEGVAVPTELDICRFLAKRVAEESGIIIPAENIRKLPFAPPVTRYTVKGVQKWTAVLPFAAELNDTPSVGPNDPSIKTAAWRSASETIDQCAPANRLIVARVSMPKWTVSGTERSHKSIDIALEQCGAWAREAGFPFPSTEWKPSV